jgi:hypothetical protein
MPCVRKMRRSRSPLPATGSARDWCSEGGVPLDIAVLLSIQVELRPNADETAEWSRETRQRVAVSRDTRRSRPSLKMCCSLVSLWVPGKRGVTTSEAAGLRRLTPSHHPAASCDRRSSPERAGRSSIPDRWHRLRHLAAHGHSSLNGQPILIDSRLPSPPVDAQTPIPCPYNPICAAQDSTILITPVGRLPPHASAIAKRLERQYQKSLSRPTSGQEQSHQVSPKRDVRPMLQDAGRAGRNQRRACRIYSDPYSQAHHADPSKPRGIDWLCAMYYAAIHWYERKEPMQEALWPRPKNASRRSMPASIA